RVCFGDPDQGTLAADDLSKNYKNIGVIYNTSDTYSTGIFDAFKTEMDAKGVAFKSATFDAENNKDFSTQIEQLKDCDVIFLPMYYQEGSLICKAATAKGCKADLVGSDGFDGIADLIDSKTVTNKVKYITPFDADSKDATVSKFVTAYKAKYNETPDQFAADAYDAVYAIYNAMKAAGVDDVTISPSDLCEKVKAAITADGFTLTGATGTMSWDASGACKKPLQFKDVL
ncbi:MAG TPA: amino acid ABC transporter substrate-binding protein, partial [Ruminococcaceae bacterium]|nr:amino acid ABC transporter substrate-binding protein [Oscillospiraceae bacterium]